MILHTLLDFVGSCLHRWRRGRVLWGNDGKDCIAAAVKQQQHSCHTVRHQWEATLQVPLVVQYPGATVR